MKKIIFLCLLFVNVAFGYNYDDVLLKAQAAIFPKVMLLDKNIEDKLIEDKIIYTIVYDEIDYTTALSIKQFIDNKFQGKLDKYRYKINLVEIDEFSNKTKASALYVLNLDKHIEKIATISKEKGIISFSYDINDLKRGLMFSLVIEKSTVLYLKKEDLYTKKIDFVDALLQMVRFVETNYANDSDTMYNYHQQTKHFYADLK